MKAPVVALVLLGTWTACGGSSTTRDPAALPSTAPGAAGDGRLESLLEESRQRYRLPAMGAMVVRGARIVEAAAVGTRAQGFPEAVTVDDRWHIGSITKSMTATLAGVLVEKGRLSWSTTVGQAFPDLVPSMRPEYVDVPLEELLSHTSGLPNDPDRTPSWGAIVGDRTVPGVEQRRRWLPELLALAPNGPRGTWYYSNVGYVVAGAMIDRLLDEPWEAVIRRELFDPLGMTSVGFGAPGTPGQRDQPWGHAPAGSSWQAFEPGPDSDNPPALGPAGRVHLTFADASRYLAAHLAGARGGANVVSAQTYGKLHAPVVAVPGLGSYALGWAVSAGRLSHDGSNTLWYARVLVAPDRDFAVMAATNAGGDAALQGTDGLFRTLVQRAEASP